MGVGMYLYATPMTLLTQIKKLNDATPTAQLVQTKNKQCKIAIIYNVIIPIYLTSAPDPG